MRCCAEQHSVCTAALGRATHMHSSSTMGISCVAAANAGAIPCCRGMCLPRRSPESGQTERRLVVPVAVSEYTHNAVCGAVH